MADITMCGNDNCTKREQCFRYTATPSQWQSYAAFTQDEYGKCIHFWDKETTWTGPKK